MIGREIFTGMIGLFWIAEAAFGALVVYWFVTQGFDGDETTADATGVALEDRSTTLGSLAIWAGFFGLLVLDVIGA
ncbi:hypothetical protein [Halorussus marinus]|uniref:hypothetical protein n=1 Tax=Halorussus marinus TaxID=2505976 RepID=UPI001092D0C7|nr:hypothetical protein [Halorussus marinus]